MESKYLEIIEQTEDEKTETKTVRLRLKVKVKDKTEAIEKLASLKAGKTFEGKKYTARIHTCRHNKNGKNQPCSVEILKEVK